MNFRPLVSSVAIVLLAACAEPEVPAEQQFVNDVTAALGGQAAIESVTTYSMEGVGRMLNVGQDMTPESATMEFEISDYRMEVNLADGANHTSLTRTPLFDYFRGRDPMQMVSGYDDGIAWDLGPDGSARRAHDDVAADRRSTYYHHPLPLLRAVLLDSATVDNVRNEGALTLADIATADGEELTLAVDATNHLPAFVRSTDFHSYLRDIVRVTSFSDYSQAGELMLPATLNQSLDEFNLFRLELTAQTPNADIGDVSAPAEAVAASPISGTPPALVVAEEVADGVWRLAGQSHHSVLIEFSDHLVIFEVPNEARVEAMLAKAAELVPDKPVTRVINSHHHFDHSGGVRAAVANGLTVVTQDANETFFRRMAIQPSTIAPDALENSPQSINIETVSEQRTYQDDAMTLELYHVAGSPHSGSILVGYLPAQRMLIQVDLFTPGRTTPQLFAPNLLENIERHELEIDTVLGLHGDIFGIELLREAVSALQN